MKELEEKEMPLYAEWHNKPLRLTKKESNKPHIILSDFFGRYSLKDIRKSMKSWLVEAITPQDTVAAIDLLGLYGDMEKLIEAAWIIHENKMLETAAANPTAEHDHARPEKSRYRKTGKLEIID